MGYTWDFSPFGPYLPALVRAVGVTLSLTVLSSLLGTLLGVPLALCLRSEPVIRTPVALLVDVIRAVPNLVLILFVYYFPFHQLFSAPPLSGYHSVLIALSLAQACYSADLIRSAIANVPRNIIQGVEGIGFRKIDVVRYVSLPSVIRQVLPAHIALWIGNLKLSSLASVIGVEDVVYVARTAMSQTYRSLEAWVTVALIYVALVLPATWVARRLERSTWMLRQ